MEGVGRLPTLVRAHREVGLLVSFEIRTETARCSLVNISTRWMTRAG